MSKLSNFQEQRNPKLKPLHEEEDDEKLGREARRLALSVVLPMVLRSTIELGLIDALHEAYEDNTNTYLSPSEIALRLPSVLTNPNAQDTLNRVLRLLASCSVVECRKIQTGEKVECLYRARPICRFLVKDGYQDGSFGPLLLLINDISNVSCWSHMNEVILEGGGTAFEREYGMSPFECREAKERMGDLFDNAMSNQSKIITKKFLEIYDGGFRGVNVLIDVGGGFGATLSLITSKHPNIKAINFDLPYVAANAPSQQGIEHVGGDMFVSVPNGDAIILKHVLHNWDDESCTKILKNCWKALSDNGKVIIIESVFLEDGPKSGDASSKIVANEDMVMLSLLPGAKERTKTEFESLALTAGFATCELVCSAYNIWIIEFRKNK